MLLEMEYKEEKIEVVDGGHPAKRLKESITSKKRHKSGPAETVVGGIFYGIRAFFVARGISKNRLKIWQTRFQSLGGTILETSAASYERYNLIHILAANDTVLSKEVDLLKLKDNKNLTYVHYGWIEDCLKEEKLLCCDPYILSECVGHKNIDVDNVKMSIPKTKMDVCTAASQADIVEPGKASTVSIEEVDQTNFGSTLRKIICTEVNQAKGVTEQSKSLTDSEENLEGPWEDEAPDYNKHIAGILKEMSIIYGDFFGDKWRAITYRKAANKLDKLPFRISNADDLKSIRGLGNITIKKIKEILQTGKLQRLESLKADPRVQIIQEFASVWGIGPSHAWKLYQTGYRTLQEICEDPSLSSMALIGLKYHHDIILRIPRTEVKEAGDFVQTVLEDLCPGALLTVGGSYRRGQPTCGDIDLLITHPDGRSHKGLMPILVGKLLDLNFMTVSPHLNTQSNSHKVVTYMGICRLPDHAHHRRIDIKIYPKDIYAFALVYFTGNDVLNRRIRYYARTKGFKLSDQGLFPRVGYGQEGMTSAISVPCETEQDIFVTLGLPYPEPEERNW